MTFGLVIGTMVMAVIMSVLNYLVILPAYTFFLNFPAMSAPEMRTMIVTGILPFNIIKGLIISFVFMLIFTRMRTWVEKQAVIKSAA